MKEQRAKPGEWSVALISRVARSFEFARRLVCLIPPPERVSAESSTRASEAERERRCLEGKGEGWGVNK